ncbi:MAG TPA: hypothetical protein PKM26_06320 [Syntrophorhabdaceae bacterium]|nr:hypothetical protein [Syntrophorhabdaceae bacterium]
MAFEDIIGHDRQKRFLKFFLENKNIPFCSADRRGSVKRKQPANSCGIYFARQATPAAHAGHA